MSIYRWANPQRTVISRIEAEDRVVVVEGGPEFETARAILTAGEKDEDMPFIARGVPPQISRFQAHEALRAAGLYDSVAVAIAAVGGATERAFHNTITWDRGSPNVAALAASLGLGEAQVDALFIAAAKVKF